MFLFLFLFHPCVALAATIDLTLFLAFPHSSYYTCVALTLAELYSNSLLVLFNSRIRTIRGRNNMLQLRVGNPSTSMVTKSQPGSAHGRHGATSMLHTVHFGGATTTTGSLGGVNVQEESWIDTDLEWIQMEDQVRRLCFFSVRIVSTCTRERR